MGEFLRGLGISESGIDPPALYVVMVGMICLIVHAQLRNRSPAASSGIVAMIYLGAIASTVTALLIIFPIENETLRYLLAVIYLAVLVPAVRFFGKRYLGVGNPA